MKPDLEPIRARYVAFAKHQAHGESSTYEALAIAIAESEIMSNLLRVYIEGNDYTDDGFYALGESEFLTKLEYPEYEREEEEVEEEDEEEEFEEVEEIVEVDEEEDLDDAEYEK